MIAVGWGLLIGNCTFQSMKAMFSGLGFEGESPVILLCRTGIFGFLLVFSRQICDICLGIGKRVIDLIGIPTQVDLVLPDDSHFPGVGASWVLVIIIGFILGFQLLKLFLEIGERYAIVAILTLMCPVGLAMGGSKSTKDICAGYLRTFASMILMMVTNVLFLKLILSGLATMPSDAFVLPWCVLLVGLVRVARKVDSLISKIGLSPAITADPLGKGAGGMIAMMAARTIISSVSRGGKSSRTSGGNFTGGNGPPTSTYQSNIGGANTNMGGVNSNSLHNASEASEQSSQNSRFGGAYAGNGRSDGTIRNHVEPFCIQFPCFHRQCWKFSATSNVHFVGGTNVNPNRFGAAGSRPKGSTGNNAKNPAKNPPVIKKSPSVGVSLNGKGQSTQPKKGAPATKPGQFPGTKPKPVSPMHQTQALGVRQNINPLKDAPRPSSSDIKISPKTLPIPIQPPQNSEPYTPPKEEPVNIDQTKEEGSEV